MGNGMLGMLVVLGGLMTQQLETIIVKEYGSRHGQGGMFFNAILCLSATVYYVVTDTGGFSLPSGVLLYGLVNSALHAVGFYSAYAAYRLGSFGLTRLFSSFDSIIPILFGILVLSEPASPLMLAAVALVFVSVFLMQYRKDSGEETHSLSFPWIISVALVVLSNGLISIIAKLQHNAFSDAYKNEFLIVTFAGSALWLALMGVILERDSFRSTIRHGLLYGFGAGVFNGIANVLILVSYNFFPLSFLSPVRTGLGMAIGFLVSMLLYRERFSRRQMAGVILGIASVILMNMN